MKRALSAHAASNPPSQRLKTEDASGGEDDQDTAASLRQRNRTLAAEMSRHKRTIADLEGRLNAAQRRQRNFDATVSAVHRVWYQLEDDLRSAATALGPFQKAPAEPPPPDPDGGGGGGAALLLSNLLRAPAVSLADAAAAAVTWCAKAEVACSRGSSAAVAADGTLDLAGDSDSDLEDGEVVSAPGGGSSSAAAAAAAAVGSSISAQVDASLRQRARFSTDLMAHVFGALTHASKAPTDAKAAGLQALRAELEGQKRAAAAATATLCDQLTEALQRRRDVARELRAARRDRHRALRRLEQLAAAGVAAPDGGAKGDDAALGGSGSSSSAAAAAAVAAVATGLPPKWPNGHPPPSAAAAAAGMGALPPGSAGMAAINGSAVPLSISAVAALDIADAEGPLPREDADRLKSELAAIAAAAAARLAEADAIRADKVALEKEVTRLAARAMSLLGEGPVDDETASVASGDGAPAPPPLAMAMAMSKVPPNHPDLVRLQELLKAERSLLETERARAAAADTLAINARVARETLEAALNHERQTMDAHWTAQVEGSTGAMSGAVEGLAEATAHLKHAEGDIQHVRALHVELDDVHQRLHNAQAAAHQLRHALQQAAYQAAKLESDAERARLSPPGGAGAGNAASLQARLAEATEELSQSRTVVDAVMADVETTAAALEAALAQSQALSEHVAAAEAARDDCLARLRDSRMQCEALTAQKSALELRSRDAEVLKSAAVELEAAASAHVAAHESNAAEVEAARDAAQRASESEHDAHERAAASVMQATAELRLAQRRLAALKSRCDDLQARETAAQAGEKRAQEQAATAQRRAERAKASLTRLQQYLAGGGGEGGFAGGGAGEESALLAEEVQELRKALRCSVCSARQKNCVLTKCYHMFCRECVDENLRTRHRKCPACGKGFGADDVKAIYLT